MEAIEYGLSNVISSLWKKDREKRWKALCLSLLTDRCDLISDLLRDPDRLRELCLDLSKKNRMSKFLLFKERASQQICIRKERAS